MDFQLSLKSETVGSAYPDEPLAATPDATVAEVLQLLRAQKAGALLICDDNRLVGIFTERDALRLMLDEADLQRPVSEVMSSEIVSVEGTSTVAEAIQLMADGGYRHLPVLDAKGQPTGVVGAAGVVHYVVDHFPEAIYNLPPVDSGPPTEREGA